MALNLDERKKIDLVANSLRKIIGPFNNEELELAIESVGVDIKYFVGESFDAFLQWEALENQPVISVNAEHHKVRRNFSIAHELGHLVLEWNWIPFKEDGLFDRDAVLNKKYRGATGLSVEEKIAETRANEFAAAFLISNDSLTKFIESKGETNFIRLTELIAKEFNVSLQVARIRLTNFLELLDNE